MRKNPKGNWSIGDVAIVCFTHGLKCTPPTGGGVHYKVSLPTKEETLSRPTKPIFLRSLVKTREILTVPLKGPIKPVYIRKLIKMVDARLATRRLVISAWEEAIQRAMSEEDLKKASK